MMKTRLILGIVALMAFVSATVAQGDIKIGYTNADYILNLLPEAKQIDADLKSHEKVLVSQMEGKQKEIQAKYADYQANAESWDELIRTDKEQEITALQQNLQKFQSDAQLSLEKKRETLLKPAYEKIGKAIEDTAKENNYSHVFSLGAPGFDILLYAREQDDITNLVLKKLGVTPPPTPAK